jgi:hypothetical protein
MAMAETAFQVQYRQEFIAGFETRQTLLRDTVTTEAVIKGNQATFLVADSGGASAVTRGVNGMIPARADDLEQKTATLVEWHDLVRKTSFNVFASQGNQRDIMQKTTMAVINRKVDSDIITELNTGTVNTGTATTATVALVHRAKTILQIAKVPWDGNIFAAVTPAFEAYIAQTKEFASAEYVDLKPTPGADAAWADRPKAIRWLGVTWIVHPELPGVGTNAEKCFMYHKSALGHAVDTAGIKSPVGYNEEQDYSYARCSVFMGSEVLQNSGIVVINHDGSALVAA